MCRQENEPLSSAPYQIILFYRFVALPEPEAFASEQQLLCVQLGLRGRILIASEGINGTLSGSVEQTENYMRHMHLDARFADMAFKIDSAEQHAFPRLSVRVKEEIVVMRSPLTVNPAEVTGERLSPAQFQEELARDDVIILDGRNNYEYDLGHFRGAIRPDVRFFRDFPGWLRDHLQDDKQQRILTYCTGGIRCEKLTAYMLAEGYTNVAQLDGGIIAYGQDPETRGHLFDGKCYVFDERIAVPINQEDAIIVGRCHHCGKPSDRYINCAYDPCHHQHLCCPECDEQHAGFCKDECLAAAAQVARV